MVGNAKKPKNFNTVQKNKHKKTRNNDELKNSSLVEILKDLDEIYKSKDSRREVQSQTRTKESKMYPRSKHNDIINLQALTANSSHQDELINVTMKKSARENKSLTKIKVGYHKI